MNFFPRLIPDDGKLCSKKDNVKLMVEIEAETAEEFCWAAVVVTGIDFASSVYAEEIMFV
jgi:hypothetical protein